MRERAFVPSLIGIGLVVSVISALGAPLIPSIANDLHASLSATQWSLTVTLLVGAVASPVVGRLGDGPHRRRVLLVCLAIVTAGGVLAAVAGSLTVLIAGRALQGLGLALMPITMASARDHLPPQQAAKAIAALSVTAAVGVGLGYPITGFIAEHLDVAAGFWFGAFASGVAFVLALLLAPEPELAPRPGALDVRGAALIGGGLVALLIACEKGPAWGWGASSTIGLLVAAVLLLALWVVNELRVEDPLVELRLVRRRTVLTANVTGLVLGTAMYLGVSLMTQYVQISEGLGESVFVGGLTLVPFSILSTMAARALPAVRRHIGQRATIPIGATIIAGSMLFFALTGDALWQAFVTMGVLGIGLGMAFSALPALIVGSVPADETSSAMSFYQVSRYVGFSVGSGLAITFLRIFDGGAGTATADAYRSTFVVGAAICLVAALIAWLLPGRPSYASDLAADARAIEEGELGAAGQQRLERD